MFPLIEKVSMPLLQLFKEKQLDRSHLNSACSQECNFESYQLMRSETISEDDECCWKKQSIEVCKFTTVALIRHLTGPILFEELIKFNNTGNVCKYFITRKYFSELTIAQLFIPLATSFCHFLQSLCVMGEFFNRRENRLYDVFFVM